MDENIKTIMETNDDMLKYFNKLYTEKDAILKDINEKLFEIDVRLDELSRTENLYGTSSDYKRNVFSPINIVTDEDARESEIRAQVKGYNDSKQELLEKADEVTGVLRMLERRIKKLHYSREAINNLIKKDEEERIAKEIEKKISDANRNIIYYGGKKEE